MYCEEVMMRIRSLVVTIAALVFVAGLVFPQSVKQMSVTVKET